MSRRTVVAGALMALALVGCKRGDEKGSGGKGSARAGAVVGGVGTMLAEGPAEDLRVTEDGQFATFLRKTHKPIVEGIPPQMRLGELYVVPVTGGVPRKLGDGVTNYPGGLLTTPDSKHVLFLTGYNVANQSGALHVLALHEPTAEPQKLGESVTYFLPSPDGSKLAFVDGGVLKLGPLPAGPFRQVAGEVSTAGFSPDGVTLFFKRKLAAAGGLLAVPVEAPQGKAGEPLKLADQVGDYVLSPDSKRVAYQVRNPSVPGTYDLYLAELPELKGRKVASGTTVFGFSPDSKWLARNDGGKPEVMGDLYVGPASGEPGRKVGERVKDLAFSPDSQALAFLAKYDQPAGAGLMGVVALPDGEPKLVGSRVPNFTWGSDGKYVAFLSRFLKPIYSVDLMLYQVGAEKAQKAQPGVFGYGFTKENSALVFRAGCIREGRACDFKALPLPPTADAQPATWLQGIYSYKLSEDGNRILATSARMDSDTYDVAVYDVKTQARKTLDQGAQLPAYFAGPNDSLAVYVLKGTNPGVYVAPAQP
ncbi:gliding motility protein [Vitiosangium sp. GDMCC 1.1324]|uniref:gliding motility protein n=1 Tax=Vitiosangium sp. (strain GDMCC 1.1324) TaxID=2138576 RepID=UPI000D3986D5|nr:gliding motility protein [Vitiosangium sp. GDMCC 1.1324]PTL78289.1 gliding motility protein [Vitiosangium sp. GDMCC 1.1324]